MGSFDRGGRGGGGGFRGGFGGGSRGGRSSFGAPRSFGGNDRGGDRGDRPMFSTTCSNCGKECQVPFRPTNGKPVYCSECFEKMGNRSDSRRPERTEFARPNTSGFDQNKATLDAINIKLDKILSLLQPKITIEEAMSPIVKEVKVEEIAPKAKKTVKKSAPVKK